MVILCNSALLPAKFPSFPPHQEEEGWSRGAGRDQRRAPDRGRRGAKWGICLEEIGDLPQFYQGKLGIYHNFARETWMKMVTICDWGTMEIFSLRWENCVCFFQETRDLTGEMMIECWYNEDIGAYTTRNILCMYILYLYCHIYIYIIILYMYIVYNYCKYIQQTWFSHKMGEHDEESLQNGWLPWFSAQTASVHQTVLVGLVSKRATPKARTVDHHIIYRIIYYIIIYILYLYIPHEMDQRWGLMIHRSMIFEAPWYCIPNCLINIMIH